MSSTCLEETVGTATSLPQASTGPARGGMAVSGIGHLWVPCGCMHAGRYAARDIEIIIGNRVRIHDAHVACKARFFALKIVRCREVTAVSDSALFRGCASSLRDCGIVQKCRGSSPMVRSARWTGGTAWCYAWLYSGVHERYIPDPFLKRQIRCLKKGALPIGFASRPHPNGPLLA